MCLYATLGRSRSATATCDCLIRACRNVRRSRVRTKLINQCGALHHLRQIERCGLEIAVTVCQFIAKFLNLISEHEPTGLFGFFVDSRLNLASVLIVLCLDTVDIAINFAAALLL